MTGDGGVRATRTGNEETKDKEAKDKESTMRMLGTLTAMAGIAVGLGGCSAGMGRYDVRVMPSDQLKNAGSGVSLKMDLVGVSDFEKVKYESMPIDEYLTAPSGQAYSRCSRGRT